MDKQQLLFIHGGTTFTREEDYIHFLKTRAITLTPKERWSGSFLDKELGNTFEIVRPRMPLKENARFFDWKIHFERYIPYLNDRVVLVGESLGGIFLVKYLSENLFPKEISSLLLVAPPFDDTLPNEELSGGFLLGSDLSLLSRQVNNIHFFFSEDDSVVPISHMQKYKNVLKDAKYFTLSDKNGHFNVSEFPEIIDVIK